MNQSSTYSQDSYRSDHDQKPSVIEPVKQQASAVGEELRELGTRTKEAAAQELQIARQRGEQYLAEGKEQLDDWERSVTRAVREHPLRSLAYAAGAGLLLGVLARR